MNRCVGVIALKASVITALAILLSSACSTRPVSNAHPPTEASATAVPMRKSQANGQERKPQTVSVQEAIPSAFQAVANKPVAIQSFTVGGTPIQIPAPTSDMVEAGYDNHEFMKVFVPPQFRLLAAFVLPNDLPRLNRGFHDHKLSKYALVQVSRSAEHRDYSAREFEAFAEGARKAFGDSLSSSLRESEEEFNRRIKALGLDDDSVTFGKPIPLGRLFAKQDACGLGMIVPFSSGGTSMTMGMGVGFVHVKKRLFAFYFYTEYESKDTITWLRTTTEDWADAILKANKL